MTNEITLFTREENLRTMRKFLTKLPLYESNVESTLDLSEPTAQLIQTIHSNAEKFDENCQSNIKWIGGAFISDIDNFEVTRDNATNSLASIFVGAYRFVTEYEFSQPNDLNIELRSIQGFVHANLLNFPDYLRPQIVYAHYMMPAAIVKNILYTKELTDAKQLNDNLNKAAELKSQWDNEINAKQIIVEELKSSIDKLTESFNFVGLVDGFKIIKKDKAFEKHLAFSSLMLLAAFVLAPVSAELIFVYINYESINEYRNALIFSLPALAALEFIFIYFFKIVLSHFRSVKAQILQINLRMSLCQFIQSYAAYSTKIKKDDPSALEKFENLIFSGILTNEEKIPSTFDGLDQIAKFVKSLKA